MSPLSLEEVHALLALGHDVFMTVLDHDPTWLGLVPEESQEYKNIVDYMTGVSNWCACCGGFRGCCDCESDSEEEYSEKDEYRGGRHRSNWKRPRRRNGSLCAQLRTDFGQIGPA
eukprot:6506211-Prymnesium_polylepis.1